MDAFSKMPIATVTIFDFKLAIVKPLSIFNPTRLDNLTFKKSITLLRQFIKCYDYGLYSKEKYIQGEKYLTYQLISADKKNILKMRKKDDTLIVSFD